VSRPSRYESLDFWRGVACLSVVVFHTTNGYAITSGNKTQTLAQGGNLADWLALITTYLWIGVPLFFVISGYCIAASVVSATNRGTTAGRFFRKRFLRIYPPLWTFLLIAAAMVQFLPRAWYPGPTEGFDQPMPPPQDLSWMNWLGSLTLTEEWRHHLGGPGKNYFLGHLWTLCYEEQFYALAGLSLLIARRWFFPLMLGISAIVFLNLTLSPNLFPPLPGFFFDGLWLAFAGGIAVYYVRHLATPLLAVCVVLSLTVGAVWAGRGIEDWAEFRPYMATYLTVGFAFSLILISLHPYDAVIASQKFLGPIASAGRRCYSIYLTHAPITLLTAWAAYNLGITSPLGTLLITMPVGLGISLLVGFHFHCWVETRWLPEPSRVVPSQTARVQEQREPKPAIPTQPASIA
jgi:peptidoglycan/LPS O-acetylase OafA/YrhL